MKRTYSDWFVELGALGKLHPDEQADFNHCRQQDKELQERLSALQQSNREILVRHPWPLKRAKQRNSASLPFRSRFRFRFQWALSSLAALFIFGIVISTLSILLPRRDDQPLPLTVREKGPKTTFVAYGLRIYRHGTAGVIQQLQDGETVRSGDWLQIAYRLPRAEYGYIISLDGSGQVTCHWPTDGDTAKKMPGGNWVNLKDGLILDNAPAYERFFLLTTERLIPASRIVQKIKTWANKHDLTIDSIPVLPDLELRATVKLRKLK